MTPETKVCIKCNRKLPIIEFHKNKQNKDGLCSKCKDCTRSYQKDWHDRNKEKDNQYQKVYYEKNKGRIKKRHDEYEMMYTVKRRQRTQEIKADVINHYGGKCACPGCGENDIRFLTIDHINNDGNKHRKELNKSGGGTSFYRWIIRNNFPSNLQVLCWNCNLAKYLYGECSHESANRVRGLLNDDLVNKYIKFVNALGIQRCNVTKADDPHTEEISFNVLHAALGMVTEAAEVLDIIKKSLAYKRPLDVNHLLDECADELFYMTMMLIEFRSSYEHLISINTAKLSARYPGGYSHQSANNRNPNVEAEAQSTVANRGARIYHDKMVCNVDGESVVKGSEKDDRKTPGCRQCKQKNSV